MSNIELFEAMRKKDYEWFINHYSEIFKKFGVSYVSIKNSKILGCYTSFSEAIRTTSKTEPLGSFIVQFCNGDISGHTVQIASTNFCNE